MKLGPINFKYKKQSEPLLKNILLNLQKGKLNVIIGMNGAGKTTLLDVISGLHDVKDFKAPYRIDEIVYQLQGIYLAPSLKGKDVLRLILKSNSPTESFSNLKEAFIKKLTPTENKMLEKLWVLEYGKMSIGERRWIVIRAITELDRKLYIFDEPTAGIDPASRPIIIEALERLAAKENVYVIMSTHILHELAYVKGQINFLHEGSIMFEGDYQAFLRENKTDNPDIAFQNFLNMSDKDRMTFY